MNTENLEYIRIILVLLDEARVLTNFYQSYNYL